MGRDLRQWLVPPNVVIQLIPLCDTHFRRRSSAPGDASFGLLSDPLARALLINAAKCVMPNTRSCGARWRSFIVFKRRAMRGSRLGTFLKSHRILPLKKSVVASCSKRRRKLQRRRHWRMRSGKLSITYSHQEPKTALYMGE
jgi:hypothetical protein